MQKTQIIDPNTLRDYNLLHQDFLRPKYPDVKITLKKADQELVINILSVLIWNVIILFL